MSAAIESLIRNAIILRLSNTPTPRVVRSLIWNGSGPRKASTSPRLSFLIWRLPGIRS